MIDRATGTYGEADIDALLGDAWNAAIELFAALFRRWAPLAGHAPMITFDRYLLIHIERKGGVARPR